MKRKYSNNQPGGLGRHSPRQEMQSDTTKEKKAQKGHLICSQCRAEYHEKHWYSEDSSLKAPPEQKSKETMCPGCYRVEKRIWHGEITAEGLDELGSVDEVKSLIKRVEHECWLDNPTSRISATIYTVGKLEIKTTTEWLAKRIGKELQAAFKGQLEIKESGDKEMVWVHWQAAGT